MKKEEFLKGVTYLGLCYGKEYTSDEVEVMYDFLGEYTYKSFIKAINNIVRRSKFVPKISELVEECEKCKKQLKVEVIDFMRKKGYFKLGVVNPLSDDQAERNYQKTLLWIERGTTPAWLQEDINAYYKMMSQQLINTSEGRKLLG